MGCHNCAGREEEATFVPTWVGGSWITIPLNNWGGGEFGFERLVGWWRSIKGTVVFYKFVWKGEEVEDEPEELGHVSRVAVAARFDLRRG